MYLTKVVNFNRRRKTTGVNEYLTRYSVNPTAVHSFFTSSKTNGLVLSDHCGFDGLQNCYFFPWDVRSYMLIEASVS